MNAPIQPEEAAQFAQAAASARVPQIYAAILGVMSEVSVEGIGKTRENKAQKFKFRGIDDFYNTLSPVLVRNKLVITPKCLNRIIEERTTQAGGRMAYVTVEMEFKLTSVLDGNFGHGLHVRRGHG